MTMQIIRLTNVTPCSRVEICGRFSFFYSGNTSDIIFEGNHYPN